MCFLCLSEDFQHPALVVSLPCSLSTSNHPYLPYHGTLYSASCFDIVPPFLPVDVESCAPCVLRRICCRGCMHVCVFQSAGLPADAAVTTYPGPESAYFSLFHSQPSMDNRAVRLSGVLSFCVAVLCLIFAERSVTEWVVSVECFCGCFRCSLFAFGGRKTRPTRLGGFARTRASTTASLHRNHF